MLRSSIVPRHQLFSPSAGRQWLQCSRRYYSRVKKFPTDPKAAPSLDSAFWPATRSNAFTTSAKLSNDPHVRSPPSPSSESAIPPESVPRPPPSHSVQTSPGSSVDGPAQPPPETKAPPPPPPPPTPKKGGRLRRLLLYLILTTGLAYGGGIWLSLKSDNFHDFFTEYVPYGEEAVLYVEEQDFRRRFPNATRQITRRLTGPRDEGQNVTIPGKSGLSWRVSEQEKAAEEAGNEVARKGKHTSTVETDKAKEAVKAPTAGETQAAKEPESASSIPKKEPISAETKAAEAKKPTLEEPRAPAIPTTTSVEPISVAFVDEPAVQELVRIVNNLIAVINADESSSRFTSTLSKAKEDFEKLGEHIMALREDAHKAAREEVEKARIEMEKSANELIRRIDEVRAEDAAQFREEYEAEREKLAHAYQEKIKTELQRAQEVAEQRLRNELVEQAIELNRKFLSDVGSLVEKEREGRLSKLSELTTNVGELEKLTAEWNSVVDTNLKTQQLQVAVDAARSALESSDIPKPFIDELVAVKELASEDPVVEAAISSISPVAYQRGIPSSAQIVERFRRLAAEVRKASVLPENAGIASHAASYMMSKVMFKKQGSDDGDDVESILTRAESFLEEGRFDEAAREMNSLEGWSKILSKDWLADVRRVLEVKQALEVIETEARLRCLQVE
ncbi:MICOS complex subunit mic60 [Emydomyces testavorans]|uniref:MICOS complex subunit MIC60 n=1 Tax=Emydomyces testavorans TaxID=2070801 RepID=A0AAF0IIW6_9EURO|nr:MICOS complex subunit mic60 [Emydomyces testavorans]